MRENETVGKSLNCQSAQLNSTISNTTNCPLRTVMTVFINVQYLSLGLQKPRLPDAQAHLVKTPSRLYLLLLSCRAQNSGHSRQPSCTGFPPVARRGCCKATTVAFPIRRSRGRPVFDPSAGTLKGGEGDERLVKIGSRSAALNPFPPSCSPRR